MYFTQYWGAPGGWRGLAVNTLCCGRPYM